MAEREHIYSDLDFRLKKISNTGDVAKVYDENSINQSLYSLFNTLTGERFYRREYGTRINSLLFEPMDRLTANELLTEIGFVIEKEEGERIKLTELNIDINYEQLQYKIVIAYNILNIRKTGEFVLILKKV